MGKVNGRLAEALSAIGARLKREKKHLVYELPNGRTFVTAKSPSDSRGERNALSDLRAVAGVDFDERRKAPADVRAERRSRPGRSGEGVKWGAADSQMASALMNTGLVERQLRAELAELHGGMRELLAAIDALTVENAQLQAELDALNDRWYVRWFR
jgi:hypothetical protein